MVLLCFAQQPPNDSNRDEMGETLLKYQKPELRVMEIKRRILPCASVLFYIMSYSSLTRHNRHVIPSSIAFYFPDNHIHFLIHCSHDPWRGMCSTSSPPLQKNEAVKGIKMPLKWPVYRKSSWPEVQ